MGGKNTNQGASLAGRGDARQQLLRQEIEQSENEDRHRHIVSRGFYPSHVGIHKTHAHEFLLMPFTHSKILCLKCSVQSWDLQERVQMSLELQVIASLNPC